MGFSFSQRRAVRAQVRKIAAEQIDGALADMAAGGRFDDTVHELRRRCKKIRALLRLVRPNFSHFAQENAAFRDAAEALSASRDAAVMLETFDALFEGDAVWPEADARGRLRSALEDNVHRISQQQDRGDLFEGFTEVMVDARKRVDGWTLQGRGFALIEPGLRATYARMRNRLKVAAKTGVDEDFHEWRKQTKNHGFHVSLLKDSAPDRLGARKVELDMLGEYLGDHHNLAVLAQGLKTLAGPLDGSVAKAIAGRKAELEGKAFALGRQLTVESPGAFASRFEKFWKLLPKDD